MLETSLKTYLAEKPTQEYEILGSGDARYYNPVPTVGNLELLLLYGQLVIAESERMKSARAAVSRSTPLGSVNLRGITESLRDIIKEIRVKIDLHKANAAHMDAMDGMESRHMSISDPDSVTTQISSLTDSEQEAVTLGTVVKDFVS